MMVMVIVMVIMRVLVHVPSVRGVLRLHGKTRHHRLYVTGGADVREHLKKREERGDDEEGKKERKSVC